MPSLKLSLHILRWPFWQTDDEEWFNIEMYDVFPYKATQFSTQTVFFFCFRLPQACNSKTLGGGETPAW